MTNKPKRVAPPREMLENENIQKAIKILGIALMLTKSPGLETTFPVEDQFGVVHRYHLDISEVRILTSDDDDGGSKILH